MASTIAATRANLDIMTLSIVKVNGAAARPLIARASRALQRGRRRLVDAARSAPPQLS
jgi:hypothetical protein